MKKIWLQPFPSYRFSAKQAFVSIVSGLIVFLIFYITQPFNINKLPAHLQLTYSVVYAVVTGVSLLLLTVIVPLLFPKTFNEEQWVVGKEILFILITIVVIAGFNLMAYQFLESDTVSLARFFKFLLATFLIGLLPISMSVLLKQKVLLDKYKKAATAINNQLLENRQNLPKVTLENANVGDTASAPVATKETIVLKGEGQGEKLELFEYDLWFLATADNYIRIIYRDDQRFKTNLFRGTLTSMERQLAGFITLMRCHRSYIINMSKVEKSIPTAQGLKLKLAQQEELLPVGKTYLDKIKERIQS
jgi:multidrug transporter EmrE-like cation transporter